MFSWCWSFFFGLLTFQEENFFNLAVLVETSSCFLGSIPGLRLTCLGPFSAASGFLAIGVGLVGLSF